MQITADKAKEVSDLLQLLWSPATGAALYGNISSAKIDSQKNQRGHSEFVSKSDICMQTDNKLVNRTSDPKCN